MIQGSRAGWAGGRLLLALSFGLNVFLIGWTLAGGFAPRYAKPDPPPGIVAETIAAALPAPDGALLRAAMAEKRPALDAARVRYLDALARLRAVIAAEPPDPAALRAAVAQLRVARQAERVLFGDTIIEVLPRVSAEGRRAFVASHLGGDGRP